MENSNNPTLVKEVQQKFACVKLLFHDKILEQYKSTTNSNDIKFYLKFQRKN